MPSACESIVMPRNGDETLFRWRSLAEWCAARTGVPIASMGRRRASLAELRRYGAASTTRLRASSRANPLGYSER